jgi:hypothetical protein
MAKVVLVLAAAAVVPMLLQAGVEHLHTHDMLVLVVQVH